MTPAIMAGLTLNWNQARPPVTVASTRNVRMNDLTRMVSV